LSKESKRIVKEFISFAKMFSIVHLWHF
jgi:hypothetical protein